MFVLFFFLSFNTYAVQDLKGAWFECEFSGKTTKPTDDCKMLDNDGFIFNKNIAAHISVIDSQEPNCKKKKFTLPLLTLVHIICTFGLITVFPQYLYELSNGLIVRFDTNLVYTLIFLALFPSIGSYYCWAGAVSIIGANRAGIFLSLIPITNLDLFLSNDKTFETSPLIFRPDLL